MLPEGLTSRWLGCEAGSGVSPRARVMGDVSIASGLGLLSSELRGKTIGKERGITWGNRAERLGWRTTSGMLSLFPFFTYDMERKRKRDQQQASLVTGNMRQHGREMRHGERALSYSYHHQNRETFSTFALVKTCIWGSSEVRQRAIQEPHQRVGERRG